MLHVWVSANRPWRGPVSQPPPVVWPWWPIQYSAIQRVKKPCNYLQGFFVSCLADSVQKIRIEKRISPHTIAERKIFSGQRIILLGVHRPTTKTGRHIQHASMIVIDYERAITKKPLQQVEPVFFVLSIT